MRPDLADRLISAADFNSAGGVLIANMPRDITVSDSPLVTDNMRESARVMSWVTQDLLPGHKWVVAVSEGQSGGFLKYLKLVGTTDDLSYDEGHYCERNAINQEARTILEGVLRRYMAVGLAYKHVAPLPIRLSVEERREGDHHASLYVYAPWPWQTPIDKTLEPASLKSEFDRQGVASYLEKRGFGPVDELSEGDLLDLRRESHDIFPLKDLVRLAPSMRADILARLYPVNPEAVPASHS